MGTPWLWKQPPCWRFWFRSYEISTVRRWTQCFFPFLKSQQCFLLPHLWGGMGNGRSKLEGKKTYMLVFKTGNAASLDLHMHRYIYIYKMYIDTVYIYTHKNIIYIYICVNYIYYIFFSPSAWAQHLHQPSSTWVKVFAHDRCRAWAKESSKNTSSARKWQVVTFLLVWALPKDPPKSGKIALFPAFWLPFLALPGVFWVGPPTKEIW